MKEFARSASFLGLLNLVRKQNYATIFYFVLVFYISGAGPFSDCSNPDGSLGDWCATEVNVNGVYVTGTYVYCPARGCSQYLP